MLRKTLIVLAAASALTGGLTADALARGGGGHLGGGFGGGHMGGRAGGSGGGMTGQHFAGMHGQLDHGRRFRFGFGPGNYFYDYGCSYGYPYHNPYSC
jgi:hypothetical protein